jgi:hypothetical protein
LPEQVEDETEAPTEALEEPSAYERYIEGGEAFREAEAMSSSSYLRTTYNIGGVDMLVSEVSGDVKVIAPGQPNMEAFELMFYNMVDASGSISTNFQDIYTGYYKDGYYYYKSQTMGTEEEEKYKTANTPEEMMDLASIFEPPVFPESAIIEAGESKAALEPDNVFGEDSGTILRFLVDTAGLDEMLIELLSIQSDLYSVFGSDLKNGDMLVSVLIDDEDNLIGINVAFTSEMPASPENQAMVVQVELGMNVQQLAGVTIPWPEDLDTYELQEDIPEEEDTTDTADSVEI